MGRKVKSNTNLTTLQFWESGIENTANYVYYFNRLTEIATSRFKWYVPETVDERFLELCLFKDGMCVFFEDEALGYLSLRTMIGGPLNVYNVPIVREAYASNSYHKRLTEDDSVIIYNNYLRTNTFDTVHLFASRLANLDRCMDVNINAQKTPVLVTCRDTQRLTMVNFYEQYQGNYPFIFADSDFDSNNIRVFQTGAPFIADRVHQLKLNLWNEALSHLGISSVNDIKKERQTINEVEKHLGGTYASKYSPLEMRRKACEDINIKFGLDTWCDFRADIDTSLSDIEVNVNEQVHD